MIDVKKGELILRVNDEKVTFNVFKAMKHPTGEEDCMRVDVLDEMSESVWEKKAHKLPLERCLV